MLGEVEYFPWSFFIGFTLFLLAVRKAARTNFSMKPPPIPKLPPGPKPLPLLGNLLQLGSNPHCSLAKLAHKHGPIMALKLGSVYTIIISSSNSARQALRIKDHVLSERQIPDAIKRSGHHEVSMAWMPPKQSWKSLRTLMKTNLINHQTIDASKSLRWHKVQELITFIRGQEGHPVYIGKAAFSTMLNLISTSFFSMDIVDINSDSTQEFKVLIRAVMEEGGAPNISDFFPFLAPLDLQGRRRRLTIIYDKLLAIFEQIIRSRLEGERTIIRHDILDLLLEHRDDDGSKLSMRTIKAFLFDSFVAGSDTSASTVEWAMAELLRKPKLMDRARSEIDAAISSERGLEDLELSKLPFFYAVLKETLRLHPPAPFLVPHKAVENTEINGFRVPQGSQVLVNVWAIGRDGKIWENPDCFMPERFMGELGGLTEVDIHGHHFDLIPFGSGRRMCPGMLLGIKMVLLMLASLIQSFKWKLPEGMDPTDLDLSEKFGITLEMASPLIALGIPLSSAKIFK